MLLWFVGGAVVIVWNVFHDPRMDYRLVAAGSVLPDLLDGPLGSLVAHSVVTAVVLLLAVVVATIGRRSLRRRLLALPIGVFLHLVLDGAFTDTRAFWWPLSGPAPPEEGLPSLERSPGLVLLLETLGFLALVWAWRRFGLADPARRRRLLRTGELEPC